MILFFLLPLILLTIAAVNFVQIRTPKAISELKDSVGVVVPMRNEAENVEGIVATLSAQDGPFHFYLLDDNSEDSTFELLQRFTAGDTRFTVIKGAPLADGWIGKTWALQQLFEASNEEVLVSIDADVRLTNDAINKAVTLMHGARLDFVSPYPRQIALSFAERLIQPLLQWSWLTTVPLRYAEGARQKSMAVANGQFLIVKRNAYLKSGGHESIKGEVLDDLMLARKLLEHGFKGGVAEASQVAQCKMYDSTRDLFLGYQKSLHKAFGSVIGAVFAVALLVATGIVPILGALSGSTLALVSFLLVFASRFISSVRTGGIPNTALLHPIAIIFLIILIWCQ